MLNTTTSTAIKTLFDPSKEIDRRIEKVINYEADSPERLKAEITEYIVTDHIERKFEDLLGLLDRGMQDGSPEVGVWVSGFYGSGKSSFTKYLGLALSGLELDGRPFLEYLAERFRTTAPAQQLRTLKQRHDPAVIMLDLAREHFEGSMMAEVSSVLYAKVMHWVGYAQDRKLIHLERMLERDGKMATFKQRIEEATGGIPWDEFKDQLAASIPLASEIAHELYPKIYTSPDRFEQLTIDETTLLDQRVEEMLDTIRRRTGKENIIFVLDEVGHYVAASDEKILNLQGLAENIRLLGGGKVWIVATAQQTLTEDVESARLNSAKLFKLKDRFPVGIDLEARDIREICYRRLLGKSKAGEETLGTLYDDHQAELRFNTELKGSKVYAADALDKETFHKLYPFLPQHFTILLELLGRLSRSTGGIGLRSAIKVIQDVLINPSSLRPGATVLAEQPVGSLATAVTFYDTLRLDLQRSFRHIVDGVDKVEQSYGEESDEVEVAKTIAILQVLDNLPATRENIAALLHPSVAASSRLSAVEKAVDTLIKDPGIVINEVDEKLKFLSEKVAEIEAKRRDLVPTIRDRQSIENERLKALFVERPQARLEGRVVRAGLQVVVDGRAMGDDREDVQIRIETVPASRYDDVRTRRIQESARPDLADAIVMLAQEDPALQQYVDDLFRSKKIFELYRNETLDRDVAEYVRAQEQRIDTVRKEVDKRLRASLQQGVLIFRGQPHAARTLDSDLNTAANKAVGLAAAQVFHKYGEAPVQARANLAERFLSTRPITALGAEDDPLNLVKDGKIDTTHKALQSVLDYLTKKVSVEGQRLQEDFASAPYGWSKDTVRYLVAALLVAGEIKLRVEGDVVQVAGETAIQSLRSNQAFKRVGVELREERLDNETLDRAALRIGTLTLGKADPLPVEADISEAVQTHFPSLREAYASLAGDLRMLALPGAERAEMLWKGLGEILRGDASQAAARLGAEESPLYDDLVWARKVHEALKSTATRDAIKKAHSFVKRIPELPAAGALETLQPNTEDARQRIQEILDREQFFDHLADLKTAAGEAEQQIAAVRTALEEEQAAFLKQERQRLEGMPEWSYLGSEDQVRFSNALDALQVAIGPGLDGIQKYVYAKFNMGARTHTIFEEARRLGAEAYRMEAETPEVEEETPNVVRFTDFPREFTSPAQIDTLIQKLLTLKKQFPVGGRIVIDG